MLKEVNSIKLTGEAIRLQELLKLTNDKKKSQVEINAAQKELMKMLGLEKSKSTGFK